MRKNKLGTKALVCLITLAMFLSMFPTQIFAYEYDSEDYIPDRVHYDFTDDYYDFEYTPETWDVPPSEDLFFLQTGTQNLPGMPPVAILNEFLTRAAVYDGPAGNIARVRGINNGAVTANHNNTPNANVRDGALAAGAATSWNTWSNNGFNVPGETGLWQAIRIMYDEPVEIDMMRVMWWFDNAVGATGGVTPPAQAAGSRAIVQYLPPGVTTGGVGTATRLQNWVDITDMVNHNGLPVTGLGVGITSNTATNASNRFWNGVWFEPVVTQGIQLLIPRGTGIGVGIGEWEIFQAGLLDPAQTDLNAIPEDFFMNLHHNVVMPIGEHGSTFTLSGSTNPEALSNYGIVTRGETNQTGTITVTAVNGEFIASRTFDFLVLRNMNAAEVPVITIQPVSSVTIDGANPSVILSVEAHVTDAGTLSFQWFRNTTASNEGGIPIEGATDNFFAVPTEEAGVFFYYVIVTNTNPAAAIQTAYIASGVSAVTVVESVSSVTIRPRRRFIRYGGTFQFTAVVETIGAAPETLAWSIARVEGALAPGTSISDTGLITLSPSETVGNIIVTARSVHGDGASNTIYGTAEVIVIDVDGERSPNVYHSSMRVHPDDGTDLSAGPNTPVLASFDHTGWELFEAGLPPFGPAGTRNFRGGTGGGGTHGTAQLPFFAVPSNPNFSPGNFIVFFPSPLNLRMSPGDGHSEFAIYNGNSTATNGSAYFGSEFLDVEIQAGHRLTSGSSSIVFRYQDENNFYFLRARAGTSFEVGSVVNGVESIIATGGTAGAQIMPNNAWRLLQLTVRNNMLSLEIRTEVVNRTNTVNTVVFDNIPLNVEALNVHGQVGFRADDGNINAMWNHVQIAGMDTAFVLYTPNNMFRIQSGANGNLQSMQVLQGTNWGRLQRDATQVGVGSYRPVELLQNDTEQISMGGRHRSLGDMRFNYRVGNAGQWQTASTGNSGDIRLMWQQDNTIGVEYTAPSDNARDGIRNFTLSQTFSANSCPLSGDYIHFDFYITNTSDEEITIRDMSLPVLWNNHWFEAGGGQASNAYATYLSNARNYVSLHGSYIMLERMDGASSKVVLIMDPETNSKFEYRRYEGQHDNYSINMMEEFFIYSVGVASGQTNSSGSGPFDQSYLPNTQLVLQPGESSRYGFRIFHIYDYPDLHALLYDQGIISAVVNPGTVMPIDIEAEIAIYSQGDVFLTDITPLPSAITPQTGRPANMATWFTETNRDEWGAEFRHIRDRIDEDGRRIQIWGVTFNKLGRNDIQINFSDGRKQSVMQFWIMEPLADAIQRHADFIMDNLFVSYEMQLERLAAFPPGNQHSGAAYRDALSNFVRDHRYSFMGFFNSTGQARMGTGNSFACNNSDYEQFYTSANFLAEKNITMPVRREIEALDRYFTQMVFPKNIQPFGGYVDSARARTDGFAPGQHPSFPDGLTGANAARTGAATNNIYREGVLAVKCCWQTNGFRMGGQSTAGAPDSGAARGIMHVFDRGYNYFHIANQFFSMYQIIRNNPHVEKYLTSGWCAVDFLRVAGIVAVEGTTMMRGFGKMGESTMGELYRALRYEYEQGNHGTFTKYNPTAEMQPLPGGGHTPLANQGQRATSSAVIANRMRTGLTPANGVPLNGTATGVPTVSTGVSGASGFQSKANSFSLTNPYGSEFWVDNTSEEGVYFITLDFGTPNTTAGNARWNPETFANPGVWSLPERVVQKMLGWTGMQPLWYHESTSRPMGNDWWNFQYTVGMQGAALQHWFFNFEQDDARASAMWNNVFSHSLAPFVGIMSGQPEIGNGPTTTPAATAAAMAGVGPNPDIPSQGVGALGGQWFVNRPTRPYYFGINNGFPYAQIGEGGLKLWAGLRILHTSVVPDCPHFGLTAYGGTVELVDGNFVVTPQDGLQRQLNVLGRRFQAHLLTDRYIEARIRTDFRGVEFDVENVSGMAREGVLTLRMLEPGAYNVYVDGVRAPNQVIVVHQTDRNGLVLPTTFTYSASDAPVQTIRIIHVDADPLFTGSNPSVLRNMLAENDFVTLSTPGNLGVFTHHSPFVIPVGTTLTVTTALNVSGGAELVIEGTLVVAEGGRINNQGGAGGTIRIAQGGRLVNNAHVENVTNSTIINNGTIINNARFEIRANTTFHNLGVVAGTNQLNIHRNATVIGP